MNSSFWGADTSSKAPRNHQAVFGYLDRKHGESSGRRTVHDSSAIFDIEFRAVAGAQKMLRLRNPLRNVASGVGTDRRIRENPFREWIRVLSSISGGGQPNQNDTIQARSVSRPAALRVLLGVLPAFQTG
jgi:hypothetical protein